MGERARANRHANTGELNGTVDRVMALDRACVYLSDPLSLSLSFNNLPFLAFSFFRLLFHVWVVRVGWDA